jgi:hypothetical protein
MVGVPADNSALKFLFHDTGMSGNWYFIAQGQTQVSQAVQAIPAKVPVEVQNAMTHYKTGFATFPNIIALIVKVSGDSRVREIDDRAFQMFPQLIPGIVARAKFPVDWINCVVSLDMVGRNVILLRQVSHELEACILLCWCQWRAVIACWIAVFNREGAKVQISKLLQVLIPEWIVSSFGATVASRTTALQNELPYSPILSDGVVDAPARVQEGLLDALWCGIATCLVDDDSNMTVIVGIPKTVRWKEVRLSAWVVCLQNNGSFQEMLIRFVLSGIYSGPTGSFLTKG